MGASLRAGLLAVGDTDAVLVSLVDLPDVGAPVVARVLAAGTGRAVLARAAYDGEAGHPVLLGGDHLAPLVATLRGDVGAKPYLADPRGGARRVRGPRHRRRPGHPVTAYRRGSSRSPGPSSPARARPAPPGTATCPAVLAALEERWQVRDGPPAARRQRVVRLPRDDPRRAGPRGQGRGARPRPGRRGAGAGGGRGRGYALPARPRPRARRRADRVPRPGPRAVAGHRPSGPSPCWPTPSARRGGCRSTPCRRGRTRRSPCAPSSSTSTSGSAGPRTGGCSGPRSTTPTRWPATTRPPPWSSTATPTRATRCR